MDQRETALPKDPEHLDSDTLRTTASIETVVERPEKMEENGHSNGFLMR